MEEFDRAIAAKYKLFSSDQGSLKKALATVKVVTINATLALAANDATPVEWRQVFEEMCTIPGAVFRNHTLQNGADIWPDGYGELQIFNDLHAFKNWITRVEGEVGLLTKSPSSVNCAVCVCVTCLVSSMLSKEDLLREFANCGIDIPETATISQLRQLYHSLAGE
uniref:Uncharacterized protein n=1 Tax=Anopheles atroparvus TaxID=41427 RepID=A0A182JFI5_ANOAO